MNISGVNSYYRQSVKDNSATAGKEKGEKTETKITSQNKDTIEISAKSKDVTQNTYNTTDKCNSYDANSIEKLKSDYETQVNDFKNMLRQMISEQSLVNGGLSTSEFNFSFESKFEIRFNMTSASTIDGVGSGTLEGFGENDYWGAEQTANRIFNFATSLAGDNNELLSTLKDAVLEGFNEVEKLFGGKDKLPSVCYDTLDRVNELFDQRLNPKASEEE